MPPRGLYTVSAYALCVPHKTTTQTAAERARKRELITPLGHRTITVYFLPISYDGSHHTLITKALGWIIWIGEMVRAGSHHVNNKSICSLYIESRFTRLFGYFCCAVCIYRGSIDDSKICFA